MDQIIGDIMDEDIFAESTGIDQRGNQPAPWKILIVDDEPSARATTELIEPPSAPFDICCINMAIGNTKAAPANACVPSSPIM